MRVLCYVKYLCVLSMCVCYYLRVSVCVGVCVPGLYITTLSTLHAYHHGLHVDGWCVYVGVCMFVCECVCL